MGSRWPTVRQVTSDMFTKPKWVVIIRDKEIEEWRLLGNKISGRPFIYEDFKMARFAVLVKERERFKVGNAKVCPAEAFGLGVVHRKTIVEDESEDLFRE